MSQFHRQLKLKDVNGQGAKAALGWEGEVPKQKPLNKPREAAPWKKISYDHQAAVNAQRGGYALRSKGPWPTHGGLEGGVREWNGNKFGVDRLPRPARPAYGKKWELVVDDPVAREAFVRGVPGRGEKQHVEAPWERRQGAKDAGPWLDEGYRCRRGVKTHGVLEHL